MIKGGPFFSALHSKCKKVEVGELRRQRKVWKRVGGREGQIVWPKLVPGGSSKCVQHPPCLRCGPRAVGIIGRPKNTDGSVFGEHARNPAFETRAPFKKPDGLRSAGVVEIAQ